MIQKESEMEFRIDSERTYFIEKESFIQNHQCIKSVEFIELIGKDRVRLIEAKSSSPQPGDGKDKNFSSFIDEVSAKFRNSIILYNAFLSKRYPSEYLNLPVGLQKCSVDKLQYKMYLVINSHKEEWLPPIADKLKQNLLTFFKCWNIKSSSFFVVNDDIARKKGLIQ